MSKLREIKRRINSVNNIAQVTRAMQLVAASRMRKTQEDAQRGKPYADKIKEIMLRLAMGQWLYTTHPFLSLQPKEVTGTLMIVFSPQRGLAGALPANLLRHVFETIRRVESDPMQVQLITVGKKLRDQLVRRKLQIIADFSDIPERPTTGDVRPILRLVEEKYLAREVRSVLLVYPEFVNALVQKPATRVLLPLDLNQLKQHEVGKLRQYNELVNGHDVTVPVLTDFLFEPDTDSILDEVIPGYLETQIYQAKLETVASEYSARMIAMRSASDNAKSVRDDLTLEFNKSRQDTITRELAEIVGGRMA